MSERQPFPSVADLMRRQPSPAESQLITRAWLFQRMPGRQAERRAG